MQDETNNQANVSLNPQVEPNASINNTPHSNILGMKLGELLNNNPSAQHIIMQSMNLNQNQFSQMLTTAGNNPMMNMTIGELFKNGAMGQAMQVNPQQLQQIITNPNGAQIPMQVLAMGKIDPKTGQMVQLNNTDMHNLQQTQVIATSPKPSLLQKIVNFFH